MKSKPSITCAYCKKPGHSINECFKRNNKNNHNSKTNNVLMFNHVNELGSSLFRTKMHINGFQTHAILDGEASISLISLQHVQISK